MRAPAPPHFHARSRPQAVATPSAMGLEEPPHSRASVSPAPSSLPPMLLPNSPMLSPKGPGAHTSCPPSSPPLPRPALVIPWVCRALALAPTPLSPTPAGLPQRGTALSVHLSCLWAPPGPPSLWSPARIPRGPQSASSQFTQT